MLIEGLWAENLFTMEGRHLHERSDEPTVESRGDVRIARGLRIRSYKLGLVGKADVVEFHRPATKDKPEYVHAEGPVGLWRPYPVEYKRGHFRREEGYEVQLCAQALCLEEMLGIGVPTGAIFYGKPRRRLDVALDDSLRLKTVEAAAHLHELVRAGKTPNAEYGKRCKSCSLFDCCMPKTIGRRKNVEKYLAEAFSETTVTSSVGGMD